MHVDLAGCMLALLLEHCSICSICHDWPADLSYVLCWNNVILWSPLMPGTSQAVIHNMSLPQGNHNSYKRHCRPWNASTDRWQHSSYHPAGFKTIANQAENGPLPTQTYQGTASHLTSKTTPTRTTTHQGEETTTQQFPVLTSGDTYSNAVYCSGQPITKQLKQPTW